MVQTLALFHISMASQQKELSLGCSKKYNLPWRLRGIDYLSKDLTEFKRIDIKNLGFINIIGLI